jgi:copper chaperone CopZ
MTCASCTGAIKSVIAGNMRVDDIQVDLLNGLATFTASGEDDASHIRTEIEDAGFECEVVDNRQQGSEADGVQKDGAALRNIRLRVDGMFCGECVIKVNAALEALATEDPAFAFSPVTLDVPFTNVSYRPRAPTLTARIIRNRIEALGFACIAAPADSLEQRAAAARARERDLILLRLLITLVFAIPTFVIAVVAMSLLPSGNAFRRYWETPIWGMATRGEIALWVLATPVQFGVGAFFYRRSWKSLRTVWRRRKGKVSWRAIWLPRFFRWGSMVRALIALAVRGSEPGTGHACRSGHHSRLLVVRRLSRPGCLGPHGRCAYGRHGLFRHFGLSHLLHP